MTKLPFSTLRDRAENNPMFMARKDSYLTLPKSAAEIAATPDDRFLAEMTRGIFQAGFSWKVIDNKWSGFEEAFEGFNISRWVFMSDDDLSAFVSDTRIVRNGQKIKTVGENACFLRDIRDEYDGVGNWFAAWTAATYADNLIRLQKGGSRLGGKTGQLFLRRMGVDSPVFTTDVLTTLSTMGHSGKLPTSKKALHETMAYFIDWQQESGLSFNEISFTLAFAR